MPALIFRKQSIKVENAQVNSVSAKQVAPAKRPSRLLSHRGSFSRLCERMGSVVAYKERI